LDAAIDKLRARYGRKVVYFGSVQDSRETAPMRISSPTSRIWSWSRIENLPGNNDHR
jgi:hypothetical protein